MEILIHVKKEFFTDTQDDGISASNYILKMDTAPPCTNVNAVLSVGYNYKLGTNLCDIFLSVFLPCSACVLTNIHTCS